jgi:ferric-dicitrate binding protein FerR (iron transport regulator)
VTNRSARRSARQGSARNRPPRRRSTIPALLVLLAVAGLIVLALASVSFVGTPAVTPTP